MSEPERSEREGSLVSDKAVALQRLVLAIVHAVNSSALYPIGHPRVRGAIEQLVTGLESLLIARHQHAINLLMVDDDLVVDQQPFRYAGLHLRGFVHAMAQLGVQGITLSRGLDSEEASTFFANIAERNTAVSTEHIMVGRVKLAFTHDALGGEIAGDGGGGASGIGGDAGGPGGGGGHAAGRGGAGGAPAAGGGGGAIGSAAAGALGSVLGAVGEGRVPLLDGKLEAAREAFVRWRVDRKGGLPQIEALVWGFVDALARGARLAYPLAPRDPDDLLYVHSVNVALLVLAHAKALGFRGELLKELGMAALLHDVGKLSLPPELVVKDGPLDEHEWRAMRRHPKLGAARLCELDPTTTVAALVAYEHHLRYDGEPSYPLLRTPRRPILASLLTAVADTFDSALSVRPAGGAAARTASLQLLRARAGTWLDPLLVASFCRLHEVAA